MGLGTIRTGSDVVGNAYAIAVRGEYKTEWKKKLSTLFVLSTLSDLPPLPGSSIVSDLMYRVHVQPVDSFGSVPRWLLVLHSVVCV